MNVHEVPFFAHDLYFREWQDTDIHEMVQLFDTEEMNRWTPLLSPFTPVVAAEYVSGAHGARERDGTLQLAVCAVPDGPALGEVIMFPSSQPDTVELAYAVGAAHRGQHIGARAVAAVLDLARQSGARCAVLTISSDNTASQATASAAGFVKTDAAPRHRERKGFVLKMETWEKQLHPQVGAAPVPRITGVSVMDRRRFLARRFGLPFTRGGDQEGRSA